MAPVPTRRAEAVNEAEMASRPEHVKAGRIAALGVSLALHVGLAALLVVQRPQQPEVKPDVAVSISLAAPAIEISPAVAGSSVVSPPSAIATSRPAMAAVLRPGPAVATLAPIAIATESKATDTTAEIVASSPDIAAVPQVTEPRTSIGQIPQSTPAMSAIENSVSASEEPAVPLDGTASSRPVSVDVPTPVRLAPLPPPAIDVASQGGTMGSAQSGARAAELPSTRETIAAPIATVVGSAEAFDAVANPRPSLLPVQESTVSSALRPTEVGAPHETAGVETAATPRNEEIVAATGRPEPRSIITPSLLPSAQHQVAQATHLPDLDLAAQEETEAERVRMIQSFIDDYDGGACFLMAPATHVTSELEIDGLATDRDKIHHFDTGFKEATGREARVVGQWVSQKQCAAVDFLRAARRGAQGLTIEIERRDLRTGDVLSGAIDGAGPEPIRLYWISETGSVNDISDRVDNRGERKTFTVPVRRDVVGGPYPQLLVAIIGPGLPVRADDIPKADAFFASIEADASTTHRAFSAIGKPFRLIP